MQRNLFYKPLIEDEEDDMTVTGGGGAMTMRFQMPSEEIYFNADQQNALTSREFMGKQYLVTDSLAVAPWKFWHGNKTILGYECKASILHYKRTNDHHAHDGLWLPQPETRTVTREITAWYTDKIRTSGPDRYFSITRNHIGHWCE